MSYVIGYDIGGTKCAALIARTDGEGVELLAREQIATADGPGATTERLTAISERQLAALGLSAASVAAGGISCGGPLDSARGLILSPPNLPGWDAFPIAELCRRRFGVRFSLKNDADACALAEWRFGAGKGAKNLVFLTFGTGLGAGLILGGRLYEGGSGAAGEVGHVRLCPEGPVGYGKRGSFEGFCSGAGIARQADTYYEELIQQGQPDPRYRGAGSVTARRLAALAAEGDRHALAIFARVGERFGQGLAILVDILNPDVIVVGGVYMRARRYFEEDALRALAREGLPASVRHARIVPAALGERIGDYAAVTAALCAAESGVRSE